MTFISDTFAYVVLQPTTLCNANCHYCYLPDRKKSQQMSPLVTKAVADSIYEQNADFPITLIWHGGEPLATGLNNFEILIEPFNGLEREGKVQHNIQTNATLINSDWCSFFKKHNFKIGVSIDGGKELNIQRVDWAGKPIFEQILRGISLLKEHLIDFGLIAVINHSNIEKAEEFYHFFLSLKITEGLGINIEEDEGVHRIQTEFNNEVVLNFWKDLFLAWKKNPKIRIREIEQILKYAYAVINNKPHEPHKCIDPFPTIAWNGDVCLLSPEFGGIKSSKSEYNNFKVGNILDESLTSIISKKDTIRYVTDFLDGIKRCKIECIYYGICGGGQASNKYFEHGTTNATETAFCRNSKILPIKAILETI